MKNKIIFIVAALAGVFFANNAFADGFFAETFIKPFSPELAEAADNLNAQLGQPVDHGVAAIANAYVPGAGAVIEGGYALQRGVPPVQFQSQPYYMPRPQPPMYGGYVPYPQSTGYYGHYIPLPRF